MRVRVLLFGMLRDVVGAAECEVEAAEGATAGEVLEQVRERAGGAGGSVWGSVAVAVNEVYAGRGTAVRAGDVVALLPPVSGG